MDKIAESHVFALRAVWANAGPAARKKFLDDVLEFAYRREVGVVADSSRQRLAPDDAISRFIAERTRPRRGGRVQASLLHRAYNEWARENGELEQTAAWFGRAARRIGIRYIRSNTVFYLEIELRAPLSRQRALAKVGSVGKSVSVRPRAPWGRGASAPCRELT
jgi:hypothetical protein